MSSGIPMDGNAARGALDTIVSSGDVGTPGSAVTPRQARLSRLYAFFRCEHYNDRTVEWDGSPASPDDLNSQI